MQKLHFWCTLTIIFVLMTSFDSEALEWEKSYSILSRKYGESLKQTPDGGYIVTGWGDGHMFLLKTYSNGNQQWHRVLGEDGASVACFSIELTKDGGYVCVGRYMILYTGDVYLVKTDANGNKLWSQTYGWRTTSSGESGIDVKITEDNGFIIAGNHSNYRSGLYDQIYLIKTDANGNEVWSKTYGDKDKERAFAVQPTIDGYITAGYIDRNYDDSDIYLLKVDPTGNELWNKTIGGDYDEKAFDIQETSDGGFIIAGVQESISEGVKLALLIKTASTGDVEWSKTYEGNHEWDQIEARSVKQTSDGGFIITGGGRFHNDGTTYEKAYLLKTDTKGTKTWMKTFPFVYSYSRDVQLTLDDGYIITGRGKEKYSEEGGVYLAYYNPNLPGVEPLSEIISTWSNGISYWDVAAAEWTKMTSSTPIGEIAAGDFTGDGKADVASIWGNGLWYQDGDTLEWTKVSGPGVAYLTAGDVTGDGRAEIISTWNSGIWYWDVAAAEWTKMTSSTPTGEIAAGDFTGDGKADVASCWSNGLWYQNGDTLEWEKVSNTAPTQVTAGDVTGD